MYTEELQKIKDVYGVDRWSRMKDLVATKPGWDGLDGKALDPASMKMFMEFVLYYGKVADDLAIFLDHEGRLVVNWTYWLNDPKRQRRGGLTRHINLSFSQSFIEVFRDEEDTDSWETDIKSEPLQSVIEKYRSHRLPT